MPTASSTFRSSSWIVRSSSAASVCPSVAVPPPELPITATDMEHRGEAQLFLGTRSHWLKTTACPQASDCEQLRGAVHQWGIHHLWLAFNISNGKSYQDGWFRGTPPFWKPPHVHESMISAPHALKSTYIKVCRRRSTGWNPVKWQTVRIGNANSALAFKKS